MNSKLLGVALGALVLGAAACSGSSKVSVSAKSETSADAGTTAGPLDLGNGIVINRVRIAIRKVELEHPVAADGGTPGSDDGPGHTLVAHNESGELVDGGIIPQTRQTMENLRRILEKAGCTLDDVIKCNVWLGDARDFWSFNKVYAGYFPNVPPARSTVQSPLMIDAKIEIDCVAYRPV